MLLEDVLGAIDEEIIIIKIDIEGYECKVQKCFWLTNHKQAYIIKRDSESGIGESFWNR